MSEEWLGLNGIDATSGEPLPVPDDPAEWVDCIQEPALDPRTKRLYKAWNERRDRFDPKREPVYMSDGQRVQVHDLASAGYAVVFAPGISDDVRKKLKPLLDLRAQQAKGLFRTLDYRPGQSKIAFLSSHGAEPGDANPKHLPYYLLLVGSPEEIPFDLQYGLDVERAVGRIYFDTPEEYEQYALSVKAFENGEVPPPPREVTCFGAVTDDTTARTAENLLLPLANAMQQCAGGWEVRTWIREEAERSLLTELLSGERRSALTVTSSHGLAFPSGDALQKSTQGALLIQDETDSGGAGKVLPSSFYFSGKDLLSQTRLTGSVVALFACYSAGTPELSSFIDQRGRMPRRIAPQPFVASLAQRLLANGALAVLGHIDRMWTMSFSWSDRSQVDAFASTLQRLLEGFRIGAAMESLNRRYTSFAVEYSELTQAREQVKAVDPKYFVRVWHAQNDSRNFIVLGCPAVRLTEPRDPMPT